MCIRYDLYILNLIKNNYPDLNKRIEMDELFCFLCYLSIYIPSLLYLVAFYYFYPLHYPFILFNEKALRKKSV